MKILVVDDSIATLDAFVALFEKVGYVTYPAANTMSAIAHLEQRSEINLIIVDYWLPGEDGLSFCEKVRASGRTLPIIMLSAVDDVMIKELMRKCAPLGNILVLPKPVDHMCLLKLIANIKAGGPDGTILRRIGACQ